MADGKGMAEVLRISHTIAHWIHSFCCRSGNKDARHWLTNHLGDEIMALADNHALTRAVRKRDDHGLTINDLRVRVEDAARAANLTTGRSISVSGGASGRSGSQTRDDGSQVPRRGL
jgi:hypothetical protein